MGRILLNILLALSLVGLTAGAAFGAPPAWYGTDIQTELPLFEAPTADELESMSSAGSAQERQPDENDSVPNENSTVPYDDSVAHDDSAPYDDDPVDDTTPYDDDPVDDTTPYDDSYDEYAEVVQIPKQGIEGPRPPKADVDPPSWLIEFEEWLKSLDGPELDIKPILNALGIGLVVVLGLIILATIFRRLRRFKLPQTTETQTSALDSLRQLTASVPHDKLAVAARWEVAIHALLLDALIELSKHYAIVESPDVTCREIAAHIETTNGPLTELVSISESCVFALIVATEDQYLRATALHQQIVGGTR